MNHHIIKQISKFVIEGRSDPLERALESRKTGLGFFKKMYLLLCACALTCVQMPRHVCGGQGITFGRQGLLFLPLHCVCLETPRVDSPCWMSQELPCDFPVSTSNLTLGVLGLQITWVPMGVLGFELRWPLR